MSRNPMYLALTWLLLLLPGPIVVLNAIIIPFEENRLKKTFRNTYADYCHRVRRWL
jgi:protein-S-isoprenylcysteine O-methyltransferase Ste14